MLSYIENIKIIRKLFFRDRLGSRKCTKLKGETKKNTRQSRKVKYIWALAAKGVRKLSSVALRQIFFAYKYMIF